jgi:hypothetical protein
VLSGSFRYTGTSGTDTVTLNGDLTIAGASTIGLGEGVNNLTVGTFGPFAANGSFAVTGGNGDNTLLFDANATFNSTVNVTLGNGATNATTFNTAPAGKLTYRSGNGASNTLNLFVGTVMLDATFGTNPAAGANTLNLAGLTSLSGIVRGSNIAGANVLIQGTASLDPMLMLIGFPS